MKRSVWESLAEAVEPVTEAERKLGPKFEKIVQSHATELHGVGDDMEAIMDVLRHFAHAIEAAEGEDPAELDHDPRPGAKKPPTVPGRKSGPPPVPSAAAARPAR
jgi:hypothetical protein